MLPYLTLPPIQRGQFSSEATTWSRGRTGPWNISWYVGDRRYCPWTNHGVMYEGRPHYTSPNLRWTRR